MVLILAQKVPQDKGKVRKVFRLPELSRGGKNDKKGPEMILRALASILCSECYLFSSFAASLAW